MEYANNILLFFYILIFAGAEPEYTPNGWQGAYSLEDGALHLQFRGRAKGATGRYATGRCAYLIVMNPSITRKRQIIRGRL